MVSKVRLTRRPVLAGGKGHIKAGDRFVEGKSAVVEGKPTGVETAQTIAQSFAAA